MTDGSDSFEARDGDIDLGRRAPSTPVDGESRNYATTSISIVNFLWPWHHSALIAAGAGIYAQFYDRAVGPNPELGKIEKK